MSQQDSVSTVQEGREAEERTEQLADFVVPPSRLEDTTSLKGGFGAIFGSHPAGVAVITAEGPDGPVGLTASSLSSVSADPPIIGFSLQARRGSAALVAEADTLLVHLLDSSNVAIARAFVNRPMILIADEPTGNLDPATSVGIMKLLDRINRADTTVLMATHDSTIVDQMRKRVIELDDGLVVRDQSKGVYGYQ